MKFPTYSESAARYALRTLPRLGMEEYATFVDQLLTQADPAKVARQKALEEQITTPFRLDPAADAPEAPLSEAMAQIRALWEANRATCGWFVRGDFMPATPAEGALCLGWVKMHGDRDSYVMARKLEKCL